MSKVDIDLIKRNSIKITEPDFTCIDGEYLRNFRINFKISQSLLASYLGVSKKAIEKWEQGKNKINPVVVRMIYLMEKDPHIFSMLKEVKYGDEILEFNPTSNFYANNVSNDYSIPKYEANMESFQPKKEWNYDGKIKKGEYNYGTASV